MEMEILLALTLFCNEVVAPTFVALQFGTQYFEMRSNERHGTGALSLLSITLQTVATALLATRWFVRLGRPTWDLTGRYPDFWDLRMVYEWAFPALNYVFYSLGGIFLLLAYSGSHGSGTGESLRERIPLLG